MRKKVKAEFKAASSCPLRGQRSFDHSTRLWISPDHRPLRTSLAALAFAEKTSNKPPTASHRPMSFTPVQSTLGGILIGLSAAGTLLVHGRIAGISGMVHGLRDWSNVEDVKFRLTFLLGLVGGASLLAGAPGVVLLAGGASPVTVALGLLHRVSFARPFRKPLEHGGATNRSRVLRPVNGRVGGWAGGLSTSARVACVSETARCTSLRNPQRRRCGRRKRLRNRVRRQPLQREPYKPRSRTCKHGARGEWANTQSRQGNPLRPNTAACT